MKVMVKGVLYKVNIIQEMADDNRGLCHKNKKIIEIAGDHENEFEFLKTYIHELSHAYFHEMKLDNIIDEKIEELICYTIEDIFENIYTNSNINKKTA